MSTLFKNLGVKWIALYSNKYTEFQIKIKVNILLMKQVIINYYITVYNTHTIIYLYDNLLNILDLEKLKSYVLSNLRRLVIKLINLN